MFGILWKYWRRRRPLAALNVKLKAGILFALLLWYATAGFLYFELPGKPDLGWLDGLWWSLVTMATVGYGDLFPVTPGGRYLVGIPTMVFGIGFLGYLISEIAGSLIESRSRRQRGMADMVLRNHILIVNYPRLDTLLRLVAELHADAATRERDVVLVDERLEELPVELQRPGIHFVKGDPTREEVLARACIREAGHAIILSRDPADPHSDDQNLVTTLVLERMHPGLFTVVEVLSSEKVRQVELAGADSVICASDLTTGLIAQELQDPGIQKVLLDLTSDAGGHQIYFVPVEGQGTYAQLAARALEKGLSLLGLQRDGVHRLACSGEESLRSGDRAIVIGTQRPKSL